MSNAGDEQEQYVLVDFPDFFQHDWPCEGTSLEINDMEASTVNILVDDKFPFQAHWQETLGTQLIFSIEDDQQIKFVGTTDYSLLSQIHNPRA